ncbi:hypothetical protein FE236_02525 [Mariprofundus erugo]|uniref:hypothetical protein n=1 Tax=Mariprofundus erugo TaxID=2528639 RepID=UPI0010FD6BD2|nr:hypothetical protein [Mariprofundus erugo]TLS77983.1 hypothetical protein FE236_02525 [Mariprofundus erugo]
MKLTSPLPWFMLILLMTGLNGCNSVQKLIGSENAAMLESLTSSKSITSRIQHIDQANDRQAARNIIIQELLAESDRKCALVLKEVPEQINKWHLGSVDGDKLTTMLTENIAKREFDPLNDELTNNPLAATENPQKELADTIISVIEKQRQQILSTLKTREEIDIHGYSMRQALQDIRYYHNSCSIPYGISTVAAATTPAMTPEEKQAAIDALMQLRQTLIEQGISTRAVQQKIDAVIMAK